MNSLKCEREISNKDKLVLFISGLRGAMAYALAL